MNAIKIPKLRAACAPRNVAMPRFKSKAKVCMPLTEAVHRVLARSLTNDQPFGVFAVDGRLIISNINTDRFKTLQRRHSEVFVGTYGPGLKVTSALEDLSEFFSDEVADGVA